MRNLFIALFIIAFSYNANSQTKLYVHPDAKSYVAETKTLAILQMNTTIKLRSKELKDFTQEQIVDMQFAEAENTQKAIYSWFLARKKRGELLVDIQNPTITNALLIKAGIDPNIAFEQLPSDVCKILGVEAILSGTYSTNKPMSDAAAIGMALVFGFGGATQNATVNLDFIHNDNEIVVNYFKNIKGGLGSSSEDLVNILMRKTSRRIPYTN